MGERRKIGWTDSPRASVGKINKLSPKFVLHGQRAKKGVFITTGSFTRDAEQYVSTIDPKVVLIDGNILVAMMIDHNLGVSIVDAPAYEIKKIDSDFFFEE